MLLKAQTIKLVYATTDFSSANRILIAAKK